MAQVSEGYLSHVNDILFGLEDASELERADFVVSPHVASAKCQDDIRSEDDFANCAAMYHLNLVSQRLRRGVYLLEGWPYQMARILNSPSDCEQTLHRFRADVHIYQEVSDKADKQEALTSIFDRHAFQNVSNRQYMAALPELNDPDALQDFKELVRERTAVQLPTQIVEDLHNTQNNSRAVRANRRYRRPEKCMVVGIRSKVLEVRHRFETVSLDTPVASKTSRLVPESFCLVAADRSLPFGDVVSTKPKAGFFRRALPTRGALRQTLRCCASANA